MDLIIRATNGDTKEVFEGTVPIPETPVRLYSATLTSEDGAPLAIEVQHTPHSLDMLEVHLNTEPDALYFHLNRDVLFNPFYFRMKPQKDSTKGLIDSPWQVSAELTNRQGRNMIYALVNENEGLTAREIGKLFGAPIGEILRQMADWGRVKQADKSESGFWKYYPIPPDPDA